MSDVNQPGDHRSARADAKAAKARAKAMRPWYKKKRVILPLALLVLIVLISVGSAGGGDDDDSSAGGSSAPAADGGGAGEGEGAERSDDLYPDRPDRQREDHEAELGQPVELSGYTATLTAAAIESQEFGADQIVIDVEIRNRDDEAQPYNQFDWKLQTPGGQVVDPTIYIGDNSLNSGDLVNGGSVSGRIAFDQREPGTYYVIYKPDAFDAARGIWQITV